MRIMCNQRLSLKIATVFVIAIFSFKSPVLSMLEEEQGKNISVQPTKITSNPMFPATSMPDSDWWHTLWPDPKNVILSLGVKEGARTIDLCCGDGYFTFPLAEVSSKVYGIDLVPELLEQAKNEGENREITNCQWIQGDAMKLSEFVSEPIDFVLIANTFHGIPDKEAMGKSIFSILKPEGELAIINWYKKPREETTVLNLPRGPKSEMRMSPEEVEEVLLPAGFILKSLVELPPYHYGAIFKKMPIK